MTQDMTQIQETPTLKSLFKHHKVLFMSDVFSICQSKGRTSFKSLKNVIGRLEKIKRSAEEGDASAQSELGFCYEQGLSDLWCESVKKIIEINELREQRYDEYQKSDDYNELYAKTRKLDTLLKELREAKENELKLKFERSSNEYKSLLQDFKKELEPQSNELRLLQKQTYNMPDGLLSEALCEQLAEANRFIFSAQTYQTKLTVNQQQAFNWYEKALQNGDKGAYVDLAFCYLKGIGVAIDEQKAFSLLQQGGEKGDSIALDILGHYYAEGVAGTKDISMAQSYWSRATTSKNNPKSELIYFLIRQLTFTDEDYRDYVEFHSDDGADDAVWENNQKESMHLETLALEYLKQGCFSEQSIDHSFWDDWLKWSIFVSYLENNQSKIGTEFYESVKLEAFDSSTQFFQDSSAQFRAQFLQECDLENTDIVDWLILYAAGACYDGIGENFDYYGTQGIKKDKKKALEIWTAFADQQNPVAYYRLGCHYSDSDQQGHNFTVAFDYLNKAAQLGILNAHLKLAQIYYYGIAGKTDLDLALWHIEQVSSLERIWVFITKTPYSSYGNLNSCVFGDQEFLDIEGIRLACLLFTEANQKDISPFKQRLPVKLGILSNWNNEEYTLDQVRQAFIGNPVLLLLYQYYSDTHPQDTSAIYKATEDKRLDSNGKVDQFAAFTDIDRAIILKIDEILKPDFSGYDYLECTIGMESDGLRYLDTSTHWPVITDSPDVFNAVFNWIYQKHHNHLLLGQLYFFKSQSPRCKTIKSDQETALRWFQASKDDLAFYYQGLILECDDPEQALTALSKITKKSLQTPEHRDKELLQIIEKKCVELQARIKLRIENVKLERKIVELEQAKIQVKERDEALLKSEADKRKDVEDLMAMFAHKFRSPLDSIIHNTTHGNYVKVYQESAQTMRGLLDIFSIISTDPERLKEKLKQDKQGIGCLNSVLSKTLKFLILHLLSDQSREKIHQHYIAFAQKQGKVDKTIQRKEWLENYLDLERELQCQWEQEFAKLLVDAAPIEAILAWLEQHFFKLEVTGFNNNSIYFEEYGATESLLTVIVNEILVNAFKYYSSDSALPVKLEWQMTDLAARLICRNPSSRSERNNQKGSGKGHNFMAHLSNKTGIQFEAPKLKDDFVIEFNIPLELL